MPPPTVLAPHVILSVLLPLAYPVLSRHPLSPAAKLPHINPSLNAPSAFRGAPGADIGRWRTANPDVGA